MSGSQGNCALIMQLGFNCASLGGCGTGGPSLSNTDSVGGLKLELELEVDVSNSRFGVQPVAEGPSLLKTDTDCGLSVGLDLELELDVDVSNSSFGVQPVSDMCCRFSVRYGLNRRGDCNMTVIRFPFTFVPFISSAAILASSCEL